MRNEKSSLVLRIVAGGYLVYLAYSILQTILRGDADARSPLVIVAAVVFGIVGAILVIASIRTVILISRQSEEERQQEENEKEGSLPVTEDTAMDKIESKEPGEEGLQEEQTKDRE